MDLGGLTAGTGSVEAGSQRAAEVGARDGGGGESNAFSTLGSQDFLKLLITQITNQDPFEPTSNEELLRQIASIRDIEMSTAISESVRTLAREQRFGTSTSLIGQYVRSVPDATGESVEGIVAGIRFGSDGKAVLRLASGAEVPVERLQSVQSTGEAAQSLVGKIIRGIDRRDGQGDRAVEGRVTSVRRGEDDAWTLELDTGEDLRLRDVLSVASS